MPVNTDEGKQMKTPFPTTPPLESEMKEALEKTANTIRHLSMCGVQKANSGHPGLPLGCAEIGAYLYGYFLRHFPKNPNWVNRDRFILSAGHGSMLLYSCLHLAGFNLSMEEIKNFRQLHSKTPGHPESIDTEGVETTTGPLGQGVAVGVGQALGLKMLGAKFNTEKHQIIGGKVVILAGDGCIMEGISSEASSLAGHLKLDNVVLIYDANNISLDGPLSESCSEDVAARYKAYGWDVVEIDGHQFEHIHGALQGSYHQKKPLLIVARTTIGKGSPNKAGTHKVHGSPLGEEEVLATKKALGLPEEDFTVPKSVETFFENRLCKQEEEEKKWKQTFEAWAAENPELYKEFERMSCKRVPQNLEETLKEVKLEGAVAGRKASNALLQKLSDCLPQIVGGSADLSCSDLTFLNDKGAVAPGNFKGRNIKFGVREFAMAAMANGLSETGLLIPYVGTFLTFSDYMRNAIRLCCLMKRQVIYQFTHDSIFLGEDGPTHQPVEHYAALRAMPNLHVFRPADQHEVRGAWLCALNYKGPSAIILSRQSLRENTETQIPCSEGVGKGAYIVRKEKGECPDYTLFATGSELALAFDVADELEKREKAVRVVSVPCWELFEKQDAGYKASVCGGNLGKRVSIEAGVDLGWHKFIGLDGIAICMEGFGASAPASALAKEFGFTVDSILERIL